MSCAAAPAASWSSPSRAAATAPSSPLPPDAFLGKDDGPGKRTGLQAFQENGNVSIMAIPGVTAPEVQASLIAFCENKKSCFAILDVPMELKKTNDVANFRDMYDSTYAAMYHPGWRCTTPAPSGPPTSRPPAPWPASTPATDIERGVHKAPANEVVRGCTGLSCAYNEGEQDILNPIGVNLIRSFTAGASGCGAPAPSAPTACGST